VIQFDGGNENGTKRLGEARGEEGKQQKGKNKG
jgi:hypothetical protein